MGSSLKDTVPLRCSNCGNFKNSGFSVLDAAEVETLSELKSCAFFKKGQVLLHETARSNGVYCIHTGKVKLFRTGSEGREQIIRFGKEGDLIGYRSVLSGEPISASVQALSDVHACFIPKEIFFDFVKTNPKFSLEMMRQACHELGEAGRVITNLAQKSVRERLAEVLMILRDTFGENEEGEIDVALTREEIASMVGTVTETAIRLLSEFKESQLVELKGRKIKILQPKELLRIGQVFD
ncbi:cyclic nucleotide-binding domain-containing protein [bacterium]|nr:cyclic nucleotide-binding domain-containing protein [bacterium]